MAGAVSVALILVVVAITTSFRLMAGEHRQAISLSSSATLSSPTEHSVLEAPDFSGHIVKRQVDPNFTCLERIPGYYADPAFDCQVFHVCVTESLMYSFMCPNLTAFNQQYFVCDHIFNVDCASAEQLYNLNEQLGDEEQEFTGR
ncbi:uncharacterized protein LOC121870914 isoform X2 [Homarus americanus]|uniref:uncharacterized protein LOC121870914 isoform X2 n=1 Tax=Homarus americanus TaxID=6706 RepID=UPI001C448DE5|nr:uncharacterized protein LOC121870914 isoform X2 [Homarus americanus]